jgi:hypothetical protein
VSRLERLARAWRCRWAAGVTLAVAATAVLVGAAAQRTLSVNPAIPGFVAGLGVGVALVLRRRRVDARVIARHLNRVVPALEESADLLLLPEAGLSPLERLQRTRVERTLSGLVELPPLPKRSLRLAGAYAITASLLAAGLLQGGPSGLRFGTPERTAPAPPVARLASRMSWSRSGRPRTHGGRPGATLPGISMPNKVPASPGACAPIGQSRTSFC